MDTSINLLRGLIAALRLHSLLTHLPGRSWRFVLGCLALEPLATVFRGALYLRKQARWGVVTARCPDPEFLVNLHLANVSGLPRDHDPWHRRQRPQRFKLNGTWPVVEL